MSSKAVIKKRILKDVALILVILALVVGISFPLRTFVTFSLDSFSAIYASVLATLANDGRQVEQTPELTISDLLTEAAQMKANDMVAKNYFAHNSPEGLTSWYWFDLVGYDYQYAGENLAVNFTESADVNQAWMNSPLHRANILNKKFTEIGIGTATGTYDGRPAIYVVQMFGTPITR